MSSTIIAILILASSCGALVLTIAFRHRLPPHHEDEATRDVIKIATGMLATLVALILGLLVSSAKTTFDTATTELTQSGAQVITINRLLVSYGPEADPVRALIRRNLAASIERIWPSRATTSPDTLRVDAANTDSIVLAIQALTPQGEAQKHLQTKAMTQLSALAESRWLFFEQLQNPLPKGLLVILGCWMVLLFIGLGLIAPRNSTSFAAMLASAFSMAAAVFLILELNSPLDGLLKASSAPLDAALAVISK